MRMGILLLASDIMLFLIMCELAAIYDRLGDQNDRHDQNYQG